MAGRNPNSAPVAVPMPRSLYLLPFLAFVIGSLFRMADESHIGFYKMFGTMGIAVAGIIAVIALNRWQIEQSWARLDRELASLMDGSGRLAVVGRSPLAPPLIDRIIIGPQGLWVLAGCDLPQYAGAQKARRKIAVNIAHLKAASAELTERLRLYIPQGEWVRPCLVLLRRLPTSQETEWANGCTLVNPEQVNGLCSTDESAEGLSREAREEIRAWLLGDGFPSA